MEDLLTVPDYAQFLNRKTQSSRDSGFAPLVLPDFLFDFQKTLVEWALLKGRAAIFADCGLGKTPMQLVWANNVVRRENRSVLILTPLAVSQQTVREGEKFGIEVIRSSDGKIPQRASIVVTNYERLHHFNYRDFAGIVCDESSMLKAFNGKRRIEVTEFMKKLLYRLLCTATAAPNDYTELGTHSEALGEMGLTDMLNRFFRDEQGRGVVQRSWGCQSRWRFKGHAERPFFRWVCSWARACRYPSDLGFPDKDFKLPKLIEREHIVEARTLAPGMLFSIPASNMQEEREERRRTIEERCEQVAELVNNTRKPSVIWCHLNDEGDMLEKLIPSGRQISGSMTDERKEEIFEAFASGELEKLIIKPKIGAWGLNWQHCAHVVTFASHSFEQYYQQVRRCWRFGQKSAVTVDLIASEGERAAKENLRRKADAADKMFTELVAHMNDELRIIRAENRNLAVEVPAWL